MTALVDTNVLIRHLTGDPPETAAHATAYLASAERLLLTDVVVAETVYVLQSFYRAQRPQVAVAIRSLLGFRTIECASSDLLLRATEVYEVDRLDFAEAYLVACAEASGVGRIASFDRALDRVASIERVVPTAT